MHRALFKILVVLAVGLGLTFTSMTTASVAAPVADTAPARAAAPNCSAQQAALAKARSNYGKRVSTAKKVKSVLAKAKRAEKRAKSKKTRRAAHAKAVKAAKRLKAERAKVKTAKARVATRKAQLASCRASNPPATTPTSSPIQSLCDAGLPQEICTALAGLIPGGSTASPLSLLCTSAPQAAPLCALLSGGAAPDPADLLDVLDGVLAALGLDGLLGELGLDGLLDLSDLTDLLGLLGLPIP